MSGDFDWLDAETPSTSKKITEKKNPKKITSNGKDRRPRDLIVAERALRPEQRLYARFLVETRIEGEAEQKMQLMGYGFRDDVFYGWRRQPKFIRALNLLKQYTYESLAITREHVLLETENVRREAMTPKPILFKGEETGHEEIQLGAAMRALELQGKAVGLADPQNQGQVVNINIDFSGRSDDEPAIEGDFVNVD